MSESEPTIKQLIKELGEPLIRFIPTNKEPSGTPLECAVFKINDTYPAGIIVYSRYSKNRWTANAGERYVIRELLTQSSLTAPNN